MTKFEILKEMTPKSSLIWNQVKCIFIKFYEDTNLVLIAFPGDVIEYLKVDIDEVKLIS
jgi:hypothetical protein